MKSPNVKIEIKLFGLTFFSKTKTVTFPTVDIDKEGKVHLYHDLMVYGKIHAMGNISTQKHCVAEGNMGANIVEQSQTIYDALNSIPKL